MDWNTYTTAQLGYKTPYSFTDPNALFAWWEDKLAEGWSFGGVQVDPMTGREVPNVFAILDPMGEPVRVGFTDNQLLGWGLTRDQLFMDLSGIEQQASYTTPGELSYGTPATSGTASSMLNPILLIGAAVAAYFLLK